MGKERTDSGGGIFSVKENSAYSAITANVPIFRYT
jgi:hypothetical protein